MRIAHREVRVPSQTALIVGFSADVQEEIRQVSKATNTLCAFANSSSKALKFLEQKWVDHVAIDIDRIDTFAPLLIRDIRNLASSRSLLRVVTTSRSRFSGLVDQLHNAGASAFYQKPVDYRALLNVPIWRKTAVCPEMSVRVAAE
jgi:DNA-binding NtrC family response regulator